ncbi:MAG: LLM class F420-dependent oxidoreductase [Actinomycetota bacterium]
MSNHGAKPFRFGVQTQKAGSRQEWRELITKIEDLGYGTVSLPDHFDDQLAPTVALMAAADASERLKLGALVWCNDYRHPVVLAKETATLDLLSDGRLEMGIGAGWMKVDYDQSGMAYDRAGVRIDRMVEAIEVLKGLYGDGPVHFDGEHYQIDGLEGTPKPVQRPHPPFLIGGGGPRFLRLAGRHADIVGINFNLAAGAITPDIGSDATAERYAEKLSWVRDGAGDRFDDVELQVRVFMVSVTDDRQGMAEMLAGGFGLTPEQALQTPFALAGTTAQIAEDLRERRERFGINYVVVGQDVVEDFAPVVAELAGT